MVRSPPTGAEAAGDGGSIPGLARSPGGGNFQYSCLENPWTEKPGRLHPCGCKELAGLVALWWLGSSQIRDPTPVSSIDRQVLYH